MNTYLPKEHRLSALNMSSHLIFIMMPETRDYHSHFTDGQTEPQTESVTCLSHLVKLEFEFSSAWCEVLYLLKVLKPHSWSLDSIPQGRTHPRGYKDMEAGTSSINRRLSSSAPHSQRQNSLTGLPPSVVCISEHAP